MREFTWRDAFPFAFVGLFGTGLLVAVVAFGYEPSLQSVAIAAYAGLMAAGLGVFRLMTKF